MILSEKLRRAILYAAIQGCLTQQLESDSSVDDLLCGIKKEKATYKPTANYGEIASDEIPFDIPDSWRWVRIIDVVKSITAGGDKPSNFSKDRGTMYNVPVISNGETNLGIMGYTNEPIITEKSLTVSGRGTIGFSVIRTEPYVPIVRLLVILPLSSTNLEYLQIVLQALIERGSGTAVKQLTVPMISPKVIPLPPIEEQQRIVERVNELMNKLDDYVITESKLKELKKNFPTDMRDSIIHYAMQGKLTQQLESDSSVDDLLSDLKEDIIQSKHKSRGKKSLQMDIELFEIPDSWRWVKLSECGTTNIGLTYSPQDISENDGTIVLRSSNIQNGKMDYQDIVKVKMDVPENKKCHIGDILICARNGSKRLVGKSAIIDQEGMAFGAFMAIYRSKCNPYINYVLASPHFRKSVLGGANTSTINQVTQDMIENYMIPLPPIEEQQRIVARLDELLPLCDGLTE